MLWRIWRSPAVCLAPLTARASPPAGASCSGHQEGTGLFYFRPNPASAACGTNAQSSLCTKHPPPCPGHGTAPLSVRASPRYGYGRAAAGSRRPRAFFFGRDPCGTNATALWVPNAELCVLCPGLASLLFLLGVAAGAQGRPPAGASLCGRGPPRDRGAAGRAAALPFTPGEACGPGERSHLMPTRGQGAARRGLRPRMRCLPARRAV